MPYHSHKLNSSHSHIIGRTDPITGDSVQQNDKVVFCAVCKSCFLEESWVYMNERHCEQSQTLDSVPTLPSKLIVKKRNEEMIVELRDNSSSGIMNLFSFILTFFAVGFGLKATTVFPLELAMLCGGVGGIIIGSVSSIYTSGRKFKRITGEDKNDIRLFYTRIEIGKDSFSWNDIQQIKFQRQLLLSPIHHNGIPIIESATPLLLIYFKEGKFVNYSLPTDNYKKNEEFLLGLEKISHFTEVFFYSENWEELQTMNTIQSNSNGNIQIGQPQKTVDYHGRVVFTTLEE